MPVENVAVSNMAGLPQLFGVCIYSFMCHHSLWVTHTHIQPGGRATALCVIPWLHSAIECMLTCASPKWHCIAYIEGRRCWRLYRIRRQLGGCWLLWLPSPSRFTCSCRSQRCSGLHRKSSQRLLVCSNVYSCTTIFARKHLNRTSYLRSSANVLTVLCEN